MHHVIRLIATFALQHPVITVAVIANFVWNTWTKVVTIASTVHTFFPPWDWKPNFVVEGLEDFPAWQDVFYRFFHHRYYKLFIYIAGYVAINGRSTMWSSISMKNQMAPK